MRRPRPVGPLRRPRPGCFIAVMSRIFHALVLALVAACSHAPTQRPAPLALGDFQPRSMLHLPTHQVLHARFPVVDFHSHANARLLEGRNVIPPDQLIQDMDATNVRTLVILTGRWGQPLQRIVS